MIELIEEGVRKMTSLAQYSTPIEHIGNHVGILVLHGFGCTTDTVAPWAEAFQEHGYTVKMPVLAGHGTTADDLSTTTLEQIVHSATAALEWLQAHTDYQVICGFDFGGTIAQHLAQQYHIDGLLLLNTAYQLPAKLLKSVDRLIDANETEGPIGTADIKNPRVTVHRYDRYPIALAREIIDFTKDVAEQANRIQAPLLVMHSEDDHVLPPNTVDRLITIASSKEKHLITLKDSYHYALIDYDGPRIIEQSIYFVKGIDPDRYVQEIDQKDRKKKKRR